MRGQVFPALALLAAIGSGAQAQGLGKANAALSDCMFKVKNSEYLMVAATEKNGKLALRYKKTKAAKKAGVSDAQLDRVKADYSACLHRQLGAD